MQYIISDPVITFVAAKSLKLPEKKKKKKKNTWNEISSALGIDVVSTQTKYNNIRSSFMKQARST